MTAHEIDNMASWFPEGLRGAQISEINEKVIPINTKKATKFSLDVSKVGHIFKQCFTSQFHKGSRNCNANTKRLSTSEFVYKFQNTA